MPLACTQGCLPVFIHSTDTHMPRCVRWHPGEWGTQEAHLNDVPAPWGSLSSRGRHLGSGITETVPGVLEAVGALEKDDGGRGDGAASRAATSEGRVRREPWAVGEGERAPGTGPPVQRAWGRVCLGHWSPSQWLLCQEWSEEEWLRGGGRPPVVPLAGDVELELFYPVK